MGNSQSDSGEQDAYKVIRWIPGIGQVYSATRAVVYAAKGDDQRAIDSAITIGGVWGAASNEIRDSELFDSNIVISDKWVGDKQAAASIPSDRYKEHLFDKTKFMYLYDDTPSDDTLNLFEVSRDDLLIKEGTFTNVPAVASGSHEYSYFDSINTEVALTCYLIVYSRKSAQCAVYVTTYRFRSRDNIFKVTELHATKRQLCERTLNKYKEQGKALNHQNLKKLEIEDIPI